MIAIDIVLPTPIRNSTWNIHNDCNNQGFQARICEHYVNLLLDRQTATRKLDHEINTRIQEILDILPKPFVSDKRPKRWIFSVVSGIVGFVNNVILRRQLGVLRSSVDVLKKNNYVLSEDIHVLHDDLSLLAQATNEEFKSLHSDILNTNSRIDALSSKFAKAWSGLRDQTMNLVNFEAFRASNSMALIADSMRYYGAMFRYLDSFEAALMQLLKGTIPHAIITPNRLQTILHAASDTLHIKMPDYRLLHTHLSDYYERTDIVYEVNDGHLTVVLPLLLRKKNQAPMDLYRIETAMVPFEITNSKLTRTTEGSYTQIVITNPYVAVLGRNFLELSEQQLAACESNNEIWTCEQIMLQTHKSRITCATAIFYGLEPSIIHEHCSFNYFHNIIPPNVVIHSDSWILLSGLSTPWTFNCHSKATPLRHKGSSYAVTELSSLCDCDVIGPDFYIPSKSCPENFANMVLRYPINAAVYTLLPPPNKSLSSLNTSWLYDTPIFFNQSNLSFDDKDDRGILHVSSQEESVDLNRVVDLIKNHNVVHFDKHDKLSDTNAFSGWWKSLDNIALSITFILSILGTLAIILAIFNCVRNHKTAAYLGTVLSLTQRAEASSGFCRRDASISDILPALLLQLCLAVALYSIFQLLHKLYIKCTMIKIILPHHTNMVTNTNSHLILELGNLDHIKDIYICTIPCAPSQIKMSGDLQSVTYTRVWRGLYGYIGLPWSTYNITISAYGIGILVPTLAYVTPNRMGIIHEIIHQDNYTIKLILINNGYKHLLTSGHSL